MPTAGNYREQILALLPPGDAIRRDTTSYFGRLVRALAEEFARIDARAGALIDEILPSSTSELLVDWERAAGLPDPCLQDISSESIRRMSLEQRLASQPDLSAAFLVAAAKAVGFDVEIRLFEPSAVGDFQAGDELADWTQYFYFDVVTDSIVEIEPELGSFRAGDPLGELIGSEELECIVARLKPAHTNARVVAP